MEQVKGKDRYENRKLMEKRVKTDAAFGTSLS